MAWIWRDHDSATSDSGGVLPTVPERHGSWIKESRPARGKTPRSASLSQSVWPAFLIAPQRIAKHVRWTRKREFGTECFYDGSNSFSNFWQILTNFERLVLGCVEADLCKQIQLLNTRVKALDEIYKIYMLLHRSDLNISEIFRQNFSHFLAKFCKNSFFLNPFHLFLLRF